jgi:uncharacterized protein (TIGR03067 family)
MMRRPILILFAGLLLAADAPADATKKDLDKLQGTWELVPPENDVNAVVFKVEFKGDKFRVIYPDGGELKGTFKLDASTDPKLIDFTLKDRGDFEGIYKLDGDKFTVCVSEPCAKQRPSEFAKDGKNTGVLKRLKD